jgi:P4 family phage/plasmid primase-like protien
MEMNIENFFNVIGIEFLPINEKYDDDNTLSLEQINEFRVKKVRTAKNGKYQIHYDNNAKLLSAYLKHSDNIFCLDIDDTNVSNEKIHEMIEDKFGVLPPYSLSRTKGKPHYYMRILDVPEYSNEVNIFNYCVGDLISRKKNMWEIKAQKIQNFSGELPEFNWNDIQHHFNYSKMTGNNKKTVDVPNELKEVQADSLNDSTVQIETKNDKMVLALDAKKRAFNYDDWFKLLMLCKNINVLYSTFITVSKNSGYSKFNETECKTKWDYYLANTDRKIGYKTLCDWLREDNPDEFEKYETGDIVNSLLKDNSNENASKLYGTYNYGNIYYSKIFGFIIFKTDTCLWKLNVDENVIKNDISKFLKKKILDKLTFITKKLANDEGENDEDKIKQLGKLLNHVGNANWLKGCVDLLKGKIIEESEDIIKKLQRSPHIISFSNGICYDFSIKKSRKLTKEDFQTQTTGYPWINRNEEHCETVLKLIKSLHENEDMTKALLSACACSLYGSNINEKFFVFTGEGRNGKSTIEELIKFTLGDYYGSINPSQLTSYAKEADKANSELAKLQYTRCVMTGEPENSEKTDTLKISVIKKWTGRDAVTTRFLGKDSFTFTPQFTLYLLCNDVPRVSAKDGGIIERMRIIPFPFKFTGVEGKTLKENERIGDINLKEKIRHDSYKYGFLHLLIDAWNNTDGKFYENETIINKTNLYFDELNQVKGWFEENYECCLDSKIKSSELYAAFKIHNKDISATQFGKDMKEICELKKTKNCNVYLCKSKVNESELIEKEL